jgi:hypothetical protein
MVVLSGAVVLRLCYGAMRKRQKRPDHEKHERTRKKTEAEAAGVSELCGCFLPTFVFFVFFGVNSSSLLDGEHRVERRAEGRRGPTTKNTKGHERREKQEPPACLNSVVVFCLLSCFSCFSW